MPGESREAICGLRAFCGENYAVALGCHGVGVVLDQGVETLVTGHEGGFAGLAAEVCPRVAEGRDYHMVVENCEFEGTGGVPAAHIALRRQFVPIGYAHIDTIPDLGEENLLHSRVLQTF